ncbi:MAG: hypothetical protein Q9217_005122 [Psora testacea]
MNMSPNSAFLNFWWTDRTRDTFLTYVPRNDLASLRLGCHDFSARVAPVLFEEVTVTFRSSTFTRHSRMAALERIGHHVKTFHFNMPHNSETFLAPLVDPVTGEEVTFAYEPYTRMAKDSTSRSSIPSYGSWEMTDLLVKQYPPLFHSATNVPAFLRVFSSLRGLRHLKISCLGQEPDHRYRRSIVDYSLISVRIAVERSKLLSLDTLSLLDVHPSAALYLNPAMGFGVLPNSMKRWKQIRKLTIRMGAVPPDEPTPPDHLKHLQCYINIFSPSLRYFDFRWQGDRGPCPISLHSEERLKATSPALACPTKSQTPLKPLRFPRLRDLKMENTIADASQIASFITRHHRAVRHTKRLKLKFDDTQLRTGTWNEALEPLTKISGSDSWKSSSGESAAEPAEFMDVPIMFRPVDVKQEELNRVWDECIRTRASKPYYSGISGLQKAGARTRELLFGTEEHMRRLFSSTVFGWR